MAEQEDHVDDDDETGDDLCDAETELEEHEVTGDEDLPEASGGVAE